MIVQFSGESRHDAIVNHFSLDIVEEEDFMAYIEEMGYSIETEDTILENLVQMWRGQQK